MDNVIDGKFKKNDGRKRGKGRPPGVPNIRTQVLKDAMLLAADQVGEIEIIKVLGDDGQPTGEIKYEYSGIDGLVGYLRWAAVHRPASFMMMLGRILPTQLNVKTTSSLKVTYKTVAEAKQALNERGINDLPCFLRTDHTSAKHNWEEACFVKSVGEVMEHVYKIAEFSECAGMIGIPWDTWVVREFLPTNPIGVCERYGNMPVCREFRYFIEDGRYCCSHPLSSRESYPLVAMMQSGQDRCGDDVPCSLDGSS
jgi:hypothetical protein